MSDIHTIYTIFFAAEAAIIGVYLFLDRRR